MPIEPDTKDWTWVLDRPCPECGFDARAFPREQIGAMVRDNTEQWRTVLSRDGVHDRPHDATWSPLEYACHVRDVFRLYDDRLRMMLDQEDPLYPNWDQDETAVAHRYHEQDPQQVAEELREASNRVADRFDAVQGVQWLRRGRRSDGASFTVESFGRYFAHDWIHHLWDVSARSDR